ncbi:MAG: hypothetical protein CSB46_10000 [Micrococcales bacterium]|nr:MAG: hypothetical protein CSB46_10000 [Micrococcales bacterium]
MKGTMVVARALGRTKWKTLLAWPAGLAILVLAVGRGVMELYAQPAQRVQYEGTMGSSPASWAFNGRAYDVDSLGGILAFEVGFMGQLLLPVFGVLLAVSLTRAQEDSGRLELLTSGVLGHGAPFAAAALWVLGCVGAFAVVSWTGLSALGFPLWASGPDSACAPWSTGVVGTWNGFLPRAGWWPCVRGVAGSGRTRSAWPASLSRPRPRVRRSQCGVTCMPGC